MIAKETYLAAVECDNCKYKYEIKIPRGTRIDDYRAETKCPICECLMNEFPIYNSTIQTFTGNDDTRCCIPFSNDD